MFDFMMYMRNNLRVNVELGVFFFFFNVTVVWLKKEQQFLGIRFYVDARDPLFFHFFN